MKIKMFEILYPPPSLPTCNDGMWVMVYTFWVMGNLRLGIWGIGNFV